MRVNLSAVAAAMAFTPLTHAALAGAAYPSFRSTTFAANDDGATGSNNGYLTFNTEQGTYTPSGLGAGYSGQPIIAALFPDVDTRGAGSGLTSYGSGTSVGHTTFGPTWPGVGYYSGQTDKQNIFQIILTDRSDTGTDNFDIYMNFDQYVY